MKNYQIIRMRKETIMSLIFTLFSLLLFDAHMALAKETANLSKVRGDVEVFKFGEIQGVPGKVGMGLSEGDKIVTTGRRSTSDITFPNEDVVRIMPNSQLVIKESDFKKKTTRIGLKLLAGKIFNIVQKFTGDSKYEVETRYAVAGVRGTIWSAEITGDVDEGEDKFMVKEGVVVAQNKAVAAPKAVEPERKVVAPVEEVRVTELMKTEVRPNKVPSKPVPLTPEEIAMFDILEDLIPEEIKEDIREEIREAIAEDILEGL